VRCKVCFRCHRKKCHSLSSSKVIGSTTAKLFESFCSQTIIIGDETKFQMVERFYLEFLCIPRVETRLALLIFVKSFSLSLNDVGRGVAIISEACDELKSSFRVKSILKKMIRIGKKLTGNVDFSFSVSSLLKMGDTKARDKKSSLLHYFVDVCDQNVLRFDEVSCFFSFVCFVF
jgi:hypothetical protein